MVGPLRGPTVYSTVGHDFVIYATVGHDFVVYATVGDDFVVYTTVGDDFVVYRTVWWGRFAAPLCVQQWDMTS